MLKHIILALCMFNAIHASAIQYDAVMDDVGLLSPAAAAEIRAVGDRLYKEGKVQFTVKVVADCKDTLLDGREFFNTTGIGDKEKNNGLLLYVNAANFKTGRPNKIRLLTGYGLEGMFNDAKCGRILDEGLSKTGIDDKVLTMVRLIDKEFKDLGDEQPPAKEKEAGPKDLAKLLGVIFLIVLLIIIVLGIISGGGSNGGGIGGVLITGTDLFLSALPSGGGGFGGGSCGGGGAGR